MPREVPADVWIEITKYISVRQDARSFSLTCKVIRHATLPSLFRTLSFDSRRYSRVDWQLFLRNSVQRADTLLSHPHLLVHVLEVRVRFRGSVRGNLWRNAMDKISMVISASPRVRKLSVEKCTISPTFHEAIHGKASLQSLELYQAKVPPLLHPRPGIGLTTLSYRNLPDTSSSWFILLLDSCLYTLISLDIDCPKVYKHLISRIASGGQPLVLRSLGLHVFESTHIWNLGSMCPEVRSLRVPYSKKCTFPDETFTKLKFLEAPCSTLTSLIPGRRISTVKITTFSAPLTRSDAALLRAGTAPVRHLVITAYLLLEDGIDPPVLAAGFPDLISLSWTAEVPYQEFNRIEGLLDNFIATLAQWSHLRVYRIYSEKSSTADLSRKYSQFPLAPSGDPFNRGHPSLVEFQFLTNVAWLWFTDDGWKLREVNGPQCAIDL